LDVSSEVDAEESAAMEGCGFITVVLLFILGRAILKKVFEAAAAQSAARKQAAPAQEQGVYEASPEHIREFLERISQARRQEEAQQAKPAGQGGEAVEDAPQRLVPDAVSAAAQMSERRKARAAKTPAQVHPQAAAIAAATAARSSMPVALRFGRTSMQEAVVWAEILGPPVCMRRRFGHRPHALSR
jgi:hypothetical protein